MENEATVRLRQIQQEQADLKQELHSIQQHQENFFQLEKREQQLYNELIQASAPEERQFLMDTKESSLFFANRAQRDLQEQEEYLRKEKIKLNQKELDAENDYRKALIILEEKEAE